MGRSPCRFRQPQLRRESTKGEADGGDQLRSPLAPQPLPQHGKLSQAGADRPHAFLPPRIAAFVQLLHGEQGIQHRLVQTGGQVGLILPWVSHGCR